VGTDCLPLCTVAENLTSFKFKTVQDKVAKRIMGYVQQFENMELVNVPGNSMPSDFLSRDAVMFAAKVAPSAAVRAEIAAGRVARVTTEEDWISSGPDAAETLRIFGSHVDLTEFPVDVFEAGALAMLGPGKEWPAAWTDDPMKETVSKWLPELEMRGGRLFHKANPLGWYIRLEDWEKVLLQAHSSPTGGHLNFKGTMGRLHGVAWRPGMEIEVARLCETCGPCQAYKVKASVPTTVRPWPTEAVNSRVHVDLVPMAVAETGETCMIQVIDAASRFLMSGALKVKSAKETAEWIWGRWMSNHALPKVIVSDQGREFDNELEHQLCARIGITWHYTTAYNPQSNGIAEKPHLSYMQMLYMATGTNTSIWPKVLGPTDLAYNTRVHSATRTSPYALMFGREPKLPLHVVARVPDEREMPSGDWLVALRNAQQVADGHEGRRRRAIEGAEWNEPVQQPVKIGDLYLVKFDRTKRSGVPRQQGPYRVTEMKGTSATLENPRMPRDKIVRNARVLVPWRGNANDLQPTSEWEIERILGERWTTGTKGRRRVKQFLVQFKGFGAGHDEWVSEADLHADELKQEWLSLTKERKQMRTAEQEERVRKVRGEKERQEKYVVERVLDEHTTASEKLYLAVPEGCGPEDFVWISVNQFENPEVIKSFIGDGA